VVASYALLEKAKGVMTMRSVWQKLTAPAIAFGLMPGLLVLASYGMSIVLARHGW
jgi:hypothetical protein